MGYELGYAITSPRRPFAQRVGQSVLTPMPSPMLMDTGHGWSAVVTRPTSALAAAHAQATQQAQAAHSPRAVLVTAAVDPCFPPFPIDMEHMQHMQRSYSSAACSSTAKGEKARLARPASTPSLKLAEKPIRATHTHGRPSTAPLTPGKPPQHIDTHFAACQRCIRPRTAPSPCKPSARISARGGPTVLSSASAAALPIAAASVVVHSPAAATSCTLSSCRPAAELPAGLSIAGRMHVCEQARPQTHRTAAGRIENHSAAGKSSMSDSATHPQRAGHRSVELVAPPRAMRATRQMRHASGVEARDVELRRPLSKAASVSADTKTTSVEARRASRQPLPQQELRVGLIWSQLWPWSGPEEKRPPSQCLPVTAMATAAQRRMPPSSSVYASPPAPDLLSATLSLSEFKSSFGLEAQMAVRAARTNLTVARPPRNQMRPSERIVPSGPVVAAPHVQHVQKDVLRNSHQSMPPGGAKPKLPLSSTSMYAIPRSQLQSMTIATQDVGSTRTTSESSFNAREPLRGW